MRFHARFLLIAAMGSLAAACGSLKDDLGLVKKAPDEFAVVRNAPLSLPPDFSLRPPEVGATGVGRADQRDQARSLLVGARTGGDARQAAATALATARPVAQPVTYSFIAGRSDQQIDVITNYNLFAGGGAQGGSAAGRPRGQGESALLARLDATDVDPGIRRKVDEEAQLLAEDDRNLIERMMFWRKLAEPGVVVDPAGESRRIKENAALGNPVTQGETPKIEVERLSSGFKTIKLF